MNFSVLKTMRPVFALLLLAVAKPLAAQDIDTLKTAAAIDEEPQTAVVEISAEDKLKAKVDSLRNALSEMSLARRRVTASRLLAEADSLRLQYEFPRAVDTYQRALGTAADSVQTQSIADAMTLGQNGLSMMNYCSHPTVVAKQTFPLEDFFLFYPMKDSVWHRTPNMLDKGYDLTVQATLVPGDASTLYYSSPDEDGVRNLYKTQKGDEEWSAPQLVNEGVTSNSDEIYPMLSPDGRTLYFASKGLYGMGGYDLYMSQWDRNSHDWGAPINMGFPYSSPYDDFLFMNTDDGKYSVFASNRECARDSVVIYVLEYDAMPLRKAVSDVHELRTLSSLQPGGPRPAKAKPEEKPQNDGVNVRAYVDKMAEVRALRDSIYSYNKELDTMRASLASVSADEQSGYIAAITAREAGLPAMQKRLDAAVSSLQSIELDFLSSGVVIDPTKLQDEEPEEETQEETFAFERHQMGGDFQLAMQEPEPSFDYTFKIEGEGQFAESNALPDGLVYQIQIASGANRLTVKDLKGLSPVFEKMATSLRYTYSVGVFRTYNDVLSHLNSVKRAGFRDAFIVAFKDGKSITVDAARSME